MKTDLYTKTVLTVIAIFLGLNFLKEIEIIPTAKANTTATAPTPLPTATQTAPVDVNISHIGGVLIKNSRYGYDSFDVYNGIPVSIERNRDK